MRKIWLLWGIITLVWACDTEQKVIDTGVSNPYFDGTIMDYLRSNNKNWDLTVEMIEHAGLTDLFEGQVDTCPAITFWAPPAYSILRFMLESQKAAVPGEVYTQVTDIPKELCRTFLGRGGAARSESDTFPRRTRRRSRRSGFDILLRRPWLPCEGRRVRRVSQQEDQHGKEKDTRRYCRKGRRQPGADERRSDGADCSGAAHHGPH